MKAIQINSYGGNEVIEVVNDARKPAVIEGHVLVKVKKASINPVDFAVRSGYLHQFAPLEFPITLGSSFCGVVAEVGPNTPGYKEGDKVFGMGIQMKGGTGTFAEYLLVPSDVIAHQPGSIDDDIAAIIPGSALTAFLAMEYTSLKAGDRVLVHGGAGGVGSIALQLAKAAGAYVATTVLKEDFDFAKQLGADEVIDFQTQAFDDILADYDVVVDTIGGEIYKRSFGILKENGLIVSVLEQPNTDLMSTFKVKAEFVVGVATTARLNEFSRVFEGQKLTIKPGKRFPIDQGKEAFEFQQTGNYKGKTIIEIH